MPLQCTVCREWRHLNAFDSTKPLRNGLGVVCRRCRKLVDARRRWKDRRKKRKLRKSKTLHAIHVPKGPAYVFNDEKLWSDATDTYALRCHEHDEYTCGRYLKCLDTAERLRSRCVPCEGCARWTLPEVRDVRLLGSCMEFVERFAPCGGEDE